MGGRGLTGAPSPAVPLSADDIAALYDRHARALLTFLTRRTHDPEAALDLMAETFAVAVAQRRRFRGSTDAEAGGWLFGIARNELSTWYRRGEVERRAMERLRIVHREPTETEYERIVDLAGLEDERRRVALRLEELPADTQLAIRLRVVEERAYPQVAAGLGISEPAARARVSRGLRALGEELERERVGEEHRDG
jgi:RNA polymerase sigma-70 factor (ECF subfamily)